MDLKTPAWKQRVSWHLYFNKPSQWASLERCSSAERGLQVMQPHPVSVWQRERVFPWWGARNTFEHDTICCHYKTLRLTVNEFCMARSEGWLTSVAGTALCTHRTVRFICSLGLQEESLSESLCICVGPQGRGKWCMALPEPARTHLAKLFLCLASWVGCVHRSLPVHITAPRGWVQESTWPASSAWKYGVEQTKMTPCFCYPPLTVLTLLYIYFHSAHTLARCPSCTEMARYDIPHKVLEVHPDFYCRNKSIWPKNQFLKFV